MPGFLIEPREVRAGDLDPDAVPREEAVRRRPELDLEAVRLAGLEQTRVAGAVSEARSHDAVGHVVRPAVREDVDELGDPVRVDGRRGGDKRDDDIPGDGQAAFQRPAGEPDQVQAFVESGLLHRT